MVAVILHRMAGCAKAVAVVALAACATMWLQDYLHAGLQYGLTPWALAALLIGGPLLAKGGSSFSGATASVKAPSSVALSHALTLEHAGSTEEEDEVQHNGVGLSPAQRVSSKGSNLAQRLIRAVKQKVQKAGERMKNACAKPAARLQQQCRKMQPGALRSATDGSRMSGGGGMWRRQRSRGGSWQPSMARILSGQNLSSMTQDDTSSMSTSTNCRTRGSRGITGKAEDGGSEMPLVPHAGHLAVDCMTHDATPPHATAVAQVVTTQHLLQFGALLGESSAELALSQSGSASAQGPLPSCLLGSTDQPEQWSRGWELLMHEVCANRGVTYWAWRRYLRKGLFMYKTRTVFEGTTPTQLAAFYFDDGYKLAWDESCTALQGIPAPTNSTAPLSPTSTEQQGAPGSSGDGSSLGQSGYMYARTRFPAPMAQREYIYARRVWAKADDGGCYVLSLAAPHPAPPQAPGRVVRVQDFVSGTVIRDSSLVDSNGPAAELVTVYFEDSQVSPGILNLGVRKGLWPHVQKMEAALRNHVRSPGGLAAQLSTSTTLQQACLGGSSMLPQQQQAAADVPAPLRRCASMGGSAAPEGVTASGLTGSSVPLLHRRSSSGCSVHGGDGASSDPAAPRSALVHTFSTPAIPSLALSTSTAVNSSSSSSAALIKAPAASPFAQLASVPDTKTAGSCTAKTPGSAASTATLMSPRSVVAELSTPLASAAKVAWSQYTYITAKALGLAQLPWTTQHSPLSCSMVPYPGRYMLACVVQFGRAVLSVLRPLGRVLRGVLCWVVAHNPGVEQQLCSLRARAQNKADALASHPVSFGASGGVGTGSVQAGGRGGPRRWGRKLGSRMCVMAVKMLSVPLAHRMLTRTTSTGGALLSRSSSMGGGAGGSTLTLHGGHAGNPGRTQPSKRDSSARVMSWLDPMATPDYLLGQHAELLQQHMALQQLQQQQLLGTRSRLAAGAADTAAAAALKQRAAQMRRQPAVVDGVCLTWDVMPTPISAMPSPTRSDGRQPAGSSSSSREGKLRQRLPLTVL